MKKELKVGDTLYIVSRNSGYTYTETIVKIGRKWATLANGDRVDLESLAMDGGKYSSPAQCYRNEEEYVQEKNLEKAWRSLAGWFNNRWRNPGLTLEQIKQIMDMVGLKEAPMEEKNEKKYRAL